MESRLTSGVSVMGIINCDPHSFYDAYTTPSDALKKIEQMVKAGARIIDVGAVATNPAIDLNHLTGEQQEIDGLLPLIEAIKTEFDVLISVDTFRPKVMRAAIAAGAHMINDQRALSEPDALSTAAHLNVPICLMHHFKKPRQPNACSPDVLFQTLKTDLTDDVQRCVDAGISKNQLIIDPGFGAGNYGKNARENVYILSRLSELLDLQCPILIGISRKSMFHELFQLPVTERLTISVVAALLAVQKGATLIRTHDVKETIQAIQLYQQSLEMIT